MVSKSVWLVLAGDLYWLTEEPKEGKNLLYLTKEGISNNGLPPLFQG
jgi:hypothetical protein